MAIEVLVAVFFGRRGRCVGLAMGGGYVPYISNYAIAYIEGLGEEFIHNRSIE